MATKGNVVSLNKSTEEHVQDETDQKTAWFAWAEEVLKPQFKKLEDATTREELEAIQFDVDDLAVIMAIQQMLHEDPRPKHFERLNEKWLKGILSSQSKNKKIERKRVLIEKEKADAAKEAAREKDEEHASVYGEFGQFKVTDHGGVSVFVTEKLKDGDPSSKWVQISRTRIDLWAITRSKHDDQWGVYVRLTNMDGRLTYKAIPRTIINDMQGAIAGQLAHLGVDVVREQREHLPDFLLTTVKVEGGRVIPLNRFLAVPTTGWYQVGDADNARWCFVLPHTVKFPVDLPPGELPIFQSESLHLQHGIASAGTVEGWCEQIAAPFANNSNVALAVGAALAGPLTDWAGIPPGFFHIYCASKHGKSLASGIGQSVYGRPLIPNETHDDPFGTSWLATANSIGRLIQVRSSLIQFFEELNQGKPRDIADVAYRIANGIDKMRMRGRDLEPRLTYCVPGFSTGEEPMVDFLQCCGQRVTEGMKTRFADIPAAVQPGSVFETFGAEAIPALGKTYYPLLGQLYGAVGDAWLQLLVDTGPKAITATVNDHQQEFRSRPKIQVLYKVGAPYQRSVIDRFGTTAAALRMAIANGLLPWQSATTDAGIEDCVARWAKNDKLRLNTVAVAVIEFMNGRRSWEGTASQLLIELKGAVDSAESLGHWLKKSANMEQLRAAGIEVTKTKDTARSRTKWICIKTIGVE